MTSLLTYLPFRASLRLLTVLSILVQAPFQLPAAYRSHDLWLVPVTPASVSVQVPHSSPTLEIARQELVTGWTGSKGASVALQLISQKDLGNDGFRLERDGIQANTELGLLYGVFDLLRRQRTGQPVHGIVSRPAYTLRILNHWDNPDGSVERGYAGRSLFWRGMADLAVTPADRTLWREYARANASVGINATVLNNVNASPEVLSPGMLQRAAAVAEELRPYGIRVFLSINFSSPARLGKLGASDPLDERVRTWWAERVREIYRLIPDFGGFLVKANSEGLPGPQDFGRTHADGANMLADALKPFGGLVMWRAFVYQPTETDRAKQAYQEFMPLDGKFRDNVIIQVKNGPVDFQPREPFSPLFGAMKHTRVMPELQITQEYLGHSFQLVFLAPMWEEFLHSDTYQQGPGSTVARCTDGSLSGHAFSAIAGVANAGTDENWCGYSFGQANWYAFGRLAWDPGLKSREIAGEWLRLSFQHLRTSAPVPLSVKQWDRRFAAPALQIMLRSREAAVQYMMPLGLHHLFAGNHHYGPGPWWAPPGTREDWTPRYYHKADTLGIGFDRSFTGSRAVEQYQEPLRSLFARPETCPEELLLWFHHLPWTYRMKSGATLWEELCRQYDSGVREVAGFRTLWEGVKPYADPVVFAEVQQVLGRQQADAQAWKDACIQYFARYSRMPVPEGVSAPVYALDALMKADMRTLNQ